MKKIFFILNLIFISIFLDASIFDFIFLDKAKTNYEDENYKKTLNIYDKLDLNSSRIIYNRANSLYKLKRYEEAKKLYESIQDEKISFQKWHNIGNASAKLGQIDYGIKAYELALEIKDSENTRFNLEILNKEKAKNQENNETKKNDKKCDNPKESKDKSNKSKKDSNNSKENKENNKTKKNQEQNSSKKNQENNKTKKNQEQNSSKKNQENNQSKNSRDENRTRNTKEDNKTKKNQEQNRTKISRENNQSKENNETNKTQQPKVIHISEKEMRKYQQILDKRGINTLMLPFNTKSNGENDNELKPW